MTAKSPENETLRAAPNRSQVIDLTTKGRKSGQLRRIEIFLHYDDGQLFISGMPALTAHGTGSTNNGADPHVVVHLKQSVVADVPATARVVDDPDERRPLIEMAARRWRRTNIEDMLGHCPLVVLTVDATTTLPRRA